jgi:hypothetical protein
MLMVTIISMIITCGVFGDVLILQDADDEEGEEEERQVARHQPVDRVLLELLDDERRVLRLVPIVQFLQWLLRQQTGGVMMMMMVIMMMMMMMMMNGESSVSSPSSSSFNGSCANRREV